MREPRSKEMTAQLQIVAREGIDEAFLSQIRMWADVVLKRAGNLSVPDRLCITVWNATKELEDFYRLEKEQLGVVTPEETEFLATHEAWRGYPRIHVCQERLKGIRDAVVQAVIQHEVGHALHHGGPEFYTFRFSKKLQEAGSSCGLDLPRLQLCVYFLSVAIKDREVIQWLAQIGLGSGQLALLEHMISDIEEERRTWQLASNSTGLKKIAIAALLKTLLPVEALISVGIDEAQLLRTQWDEAYGWLSRRERQALFILSRGINRIEANTFQERLEQGAICLLAEPS